MADRVRFELTVPFGGTHDFQSCAFDHSANSASYQVTKRYYHIIDILSSVLRSFEKISPCAMGRDLTFYAKTRYVSTF